MIRHNLRLCERTEGGVFFDRVKDKRLIEVER